MATVAHLTSGADTTPTTTWTSGSFTPTAGSLVVVCSVMSDNSGFDTSNCTESTGRIRFLRCEHQIRFASNVHKIDVWLADVAANAASRTITITVSGTGTGLAWEVFEINGISRYGGEAVRQSAIQANGSAAGTPATTFSGVALTGNVCMHAVGNNSSPGAVTAPASFTNRANVGYSTPTTGLSLATRDSGHTSATITSGSTSATTFGAISLEFQCGATETISPVSRGTLPVAAATGTGTTSCAPDYPGGTAEGDALLMALGVKPSTATAPTITSWSKVSNTDATGGTGAVGADTGATRVCWYIYDPDADASGVGSSPPAGSLTVTPGSSPSCCWAAMFAFRSTFGAAVTWSAAGGNGSDVTTGTPFTAAMGTDPGVAIGDLILFCGVTPTDINMPTPPVSKYSALAITGTSFTDGRDAVNNKTFYEVYTSSGNQAGGVIVRDGVLTAATGVLTFSIAAGGTSTNVVGPIALCRLRAAAGAVAGNRPYQARRPSARSLASARGRFN